MLWRGAFAVGGLALVLGCACPSKAAVSGDLILSVRYWDTDNRKGTEWANFRLLADADLRPALRFHVDLEREEPDDARFWEAYAQWSWGVQRLRLGRFLVPFGIYNRSELYYVGLILDPLVKYYPFRGSYTGRSEQGIGYLGAFGTWQVEAALFGEGGGVEAFIPSEGEGALRVQWYRGALILGLNALREHTAYSDTGDGDTAHFFGLDFRFSRPPFILRGELVTGRVPGGSPRGFYLDALYHPASLQRLTLVGRTEAVEGQPVNGRRYTRQTLGFKWDVARGTALAVNQAFESPRTSEGYQGTTVYLWYTHRL